MSSVPRDSYIYSIDPHEWDDSSFPRALIPTTVATCANLHVFPPVSPSFYHRIELGEGGPSSAANAAGVAPAPRRSARAHAASVSSLTAFPSLGAGGTRAPTETTHQLLAKLGAVRFRACSSSLHDLVAAVLPPMLDRAAALDPGAAQRLLRRWHSGLRSQERRLWKVVNPLVPIDNPPPYSVRVKPLSPEEYDAVALVAQLPTNEVGLTSAVLVPSFSSLIDDFFYISRIPVASFQVGPAEDVGSGTSDLGLLCGEGISDEQWRDHESFVIETKLLLPDDWNSLMSCLRDEQEGFSIFRTSDGRFVTDGDLSAVWAPVLAQITEQFQANRAKFVVLTDYERYMLFTLINTCEITVSRIFCRDKLNPPSDNDLNVDCTVTVMEVIMSLILLAKPSADPAQLWIDMDPVREAARKKKPSKDDDRDEDERNSGSADGRLRKRRSKKTLSASRTSTGSVTALSIGADADLLRSIHQPLLYRRCVPTGLTRATLELPRTEEDVVQVVVKHSADNMSPDWSFDSDKMPSLPWSSHSEDSTDSTPYEILFLEYLGHGRTFDAFAATLAVRLPGGDIAHVPTVVKHIELLSLEMFAEAQAGYPTRTHIMRAAEREARILHHLADTCPDVAPCLFALWTSVAYHHILMACEDCGDELARDLRTLDDDTKRSIVEIYNRLHVAGILHGDVHARHVLRDAKGRLRIVDFEGALEVDVSTPKGAAAAEQEMTEVYKMLGV